MKKKYLVAGMGISGIQAVGLLQKMGEPVIFYDGNAEKDLTKVREQVPGEWEAVLGELPEEVIARTEACVISPGISTEEPFARKLTAAGVELLSEIELAWKYEKGRTVGITGTNGKTTTTTLVGDIMRAWLGPERAFTAGNIGIPYAEETLKSSEQSVTTLELSSFQLETIRTFHPHVSAILNITPDHLNRHHTMENYAAVKERVTMNQTEEDFCVLNRDDPRLRAFGESGLRPSVIWFSGTRSLADGYFLRDGQLIAAKNGEERVLLSTDEVHLVGRCNYENILAAIAVAEAMGVPTELILAVTRDFRAVPHRIEFVRTVRGVSYYDDSKGTNPDAAIQGIRAMTRPTVLIGGGYDKGSEYDDWVRQFGTKIRKLLLMGVTREKIAACCERFGFTDYLFVDSMEEAVQKACELTEPGDAVLLSPACASWDMFKSYEQRGDIFKELVRGIEEAEKK